MKWFRAFDWSTFKDSGNIFPVSTPVPVATPTPTPTSIQFGNCAWFDCMMQGGTCVNGECVKGGKVVYPSPIPTPTVAPIPTPAPTPTPSANVIDLLLISGQTYRIVVH